MNNLEEQILNLLKDVSTNKLDYNLAFEELINLINNIIKANNINNNNFNPNDYVISIDNEKEYKSKDGTMKKTTIFIDGKNHYKLIPKDDI